MGHPEPDGEEQSKYDSSTNCDSLEKPEKQDIDAHANIVLLWGRRGEITGVTESEYPNKIPKAERGYLLGCEPRECDCGARGQGTAASKRVYFGWNRAAVDCLER